MLKKPVESTVEISLPIDLFPSFFFTMQKSGLRKLSIIRILDGPTKKATGRMLLVLLLKGSLSSFVERPSAPAKRMPETNRALLNKKASLSKRVKCR